MDRSYLCRNFASFVGIFEQVFAFAEVLPPGFFFIGLGPEIPLLVARVMRRIWELGRLFLLLLALLAKNSGDLHADDLHEHLQDFNKLLLSNRVPTEGLALLFLDTGHPVLHFFCYLFEFEVHLLANSLPKTLLTVAKSSDMLGKCVLM